jgi:hypothetical protein
VQRREETGCGGRACGGGTGRRIVEGDHRHVGVMCPFSLQSEESGWVVRMQLTGAWQGYSWFLAVHGGKRFQAKSELGVARCIISLTD